MAEDTARLPNSETGSRKPRKERTAREKCMIYYFNYICKTSIKFYINATECPVLSELFLKVHQQRIFDKKTKIVIFRTIFDE